MRVVRLAARSCPALWLLLSVVASACGMAPEDVGAPDAGVASDAGAAYCALAIVSVAPEGPLAPVTVQVAALIESQNLAGIEDFAWDVRSPAGQAVPVVPQAPDSRSIAFEAAQAGPYTVTVSGTVQDEPCASAGTIVNVGVPGAPSAFYRVRLVPAPGQGAPPQEQIVEVPGGADFALGTLTLATGIRAGGMVSATDVGPVAAYLRATPSGVTGAAVLEAFAGVDGGVELRLESRDYDVLVVPEPNHVAPALFRGVSPVRGFDFALEPGVAVGGTVSAGGEPVAGARVALRADGVPSTLGIAGADGAFTVLGRPGVVALSVVPPEERGLPRLALEPDAGVVLDAAALRSVAIAYGAELVTRRVAPRVVLPDGVTSAGFARVTWTAALPGAGVLTGADPGPVPMSGSVRLSHVAGADGVLPELVLPAAVYDVVIEPESASPAQAVTRLRVDLGAGVPEPATLVLAPAAEVRGVVIGSSGEALAGVRVSATPTGLLAGATAASATAVTAPDGGMSLFLAGGGEYELTFTSADARHGRARRAIQVSAAGQILDLGAMALRPAVRVSGRVAIAGMAGNAAGVTLRLSCLDCADMDSDWPVAEAVSDGSGRFVLAVPDPAADGAPSLR